MAIRKVIAALCVTSTTLVITAFAQEMPKTTKENIKGQTSVVATEKLHGTVVYVEGNNLVVKMSTGEIRYFNPPASRKFIIDGKELSVSELKPGTTLTATVTTTSTPVTERTTTVGTGKVWFVSGATVILTLPNNENRMYRVKESYKFTVDGKPATVSDLRKGMVISAEKIVEAPHTEIASNVAVVGQAPPAPKPVKSEVAKAMPPPREPAPAAATTSVPEPAPKEAPAAPAAELPATGGPLPLIGLLGVLALGISAGLRKLRRS